MSQLKSFSKYLYGLSLGSRSYDFRDKSTSINQHISYMLTRTQSMFKYTGLPVTIPERNLELYLQMNGNCCFWEYNGELYAFVGGLGGEPDVYEMPTIYTISNPALKISRSLKIDIECVVVPNDSLYIGLMPMFTKYATQLAETELSLDIATVNSRIYNLISAPDDRTEDSANHFLEDVRSGKLGIISENAFLDGIKSQPYGNAGNRVITDLIELNQYYRASWFNDIGLNANYNMKRESLNTTESQLNNDALLPLIDDMLRCRKKGIEKVNAMFGTNITVDYASSWEDNQIELKNEQDAEDDPGAEENGGGADDEYETPTPD